jgi:hypothetical protein
MARTNTEPPHSFFAALPKSPRPNKERTEQALVRTLKSETVYEDSHPSIRERTEALGIPADPTNTKDIERILHLLGTVDRSAAEAFFGARLDAVIKEFDQKWATNLKTEWADWHRDFKESEDSLQKLAGRDPESFTLEEAKEWIAAKAHIEGFETTKAQALALAQMYPASGELQYFAGRALLELDDESGVAYLEKAAELEGRLQTAAHSSIADFRAARGESHAARESSIAAAAAQDAIQAKYERLYEINPGDEVHPSGASAEEVARLASLLPKVKRAKEAYAIRRIDPAEPTIHLDILVIVLPKNVMVSSIEEYTDGEVANAYKVFETTSLAVKAIVDKSPLAKTLADRPELRIYQAT